MKITYWLNDKKREDDVAPGMMLLELLRKRGCYSVKCGCETTNCGLCTVWLDGRPVLSCAVLAVRIDGHRLTTLEGLEAEAREFAVFMGQEGGDQCGFCNPGFVMAVLAMVKELQEPTEQEIKEYLVGNLCRCTGYMSHLRALRKYVAYKQEVRA